jgi:hypothetical protein
VLRHSGNLSSALLRSRRRFYSAIAFEWDDCDQRCEFKQTLAASAGSAAAFRALLTRRFGAQENRVAEFGFENQKEEFMKHFLLILSVLALIGTATAATPPKKESCCKGKECCSTGCCKK